jgi:hypothetical protein
LRPRGAGRRHSQCNRATYRQRAGAWSLGIAQRVAGADHATAFDSFGNPVAQRGTFDDHAPYGDCLAGRHTCGGLDKALA